MRRTVLLLTLVAAMLLACSGVVLAESTTPATSQSDSPKKTPKEKISGSYIVVLNDNEDPDQVVEKKKQEIANLKVKHVYKTALKGFAVEIPDEEASKLRDNPEVKYVEQDQVATAIAQNDNPKNSARRKPPSGGGGTTRQSQQLPWGINQIDADLSSTLAGNGSGTVNGVKAYIIDTGIDTTHPDLNVSTMDGVSYINDGYGINDCAGHGTHVAGTVAAKDDPYDVVGAAPSVQLVSVRVLNCQGSGTYSGVIAGVDWVTQHAVKPAIANMSLGGGLSQALNDAVKNSATQGIFYSLAAGNDGANACNYSPAAAGVNDGVMTVGATDSSDAETSFSNYGSCVDVWAPGANILSTKKGGGTTTMSGTSMASPHVGGSGALYLSQHTGDSPTVVENALKSAAQSTGTQSKDGNPITRLWVGDPTRF